MAWNHKVLISTSIVVVGALLAFIGYIEMLSRPEFGLSTVEVWRESLLMMGALLAWPLNAPALGLQRVHDIPWQLELARFVVPLGVFSGAALLVSGLFGAHIRAFRARFMRDHIIVCAGGPAAWQFVDDLRRERRNRFVVLDLAANRLDYRERPPVPILAGADKNHERLLLQAGAPRAQAIVAIGNDDMRDIEIVLSAKTIAARYRPDHMPPLMGRATILGGSAEDAVEALFGPHDRSFAFHPISIARNAIRLLLKTYPLDGDPAVRGGGRLHVRIIGFDQTGQELALELARSGHLIDERPPLVTIVDPEIKTLFVRLAQNRPELDQAADFRLVAADIENLLAWDDPTDGTPPSRTVVCLKSELSALQMAAALRQRWTAAGKEPGPIFVHLSRAPIAAATLRGGGLPGDAHAILPFGDDASLFTREVVLEETLDTLAREVHEHYRENRGSEGEAARMVVADQPWDDLREGFREASRNQADHILLALRIVGCDVGPASGAAAFAFSTDEIETLARVEHRRWSAERRVAGWRFAPHRRDEAREHPSLIPWEELSESEREKDREAVRAIPAILARAGLGIRRGPGEPRSP